MKEMFRWTAHKAAEGVGTPAAFLGACVLLMVWAATGPMFHYSDTWQLIINTGTTIVTFLMVFLIQYVQNRDNKTIHLKLDELIKALDSARNDMMDLDKLSDEDLAKLERQYQDICLRARARGTSPPQPAAR